MNKAIYDNFDQEFFVEEYEDSMDFKDEIISMSKKDGDRLYYLFRDAKNWVTLKYLNGETDVKEMHSNFKYAMQGIYGHLKTLANFGKPTKVPVGRDEVELVNSDYSYDTVFTLWSAYMYASICRNKDVMDLVFSQEESAIFFKDGRHDDTPAYKILNLFRNESRVTQETFEDYRKSMRERTNGADEKDYRELISEPLMVLEQAYFFESEKPFNEALKMALDKNRNYYDAEKDNRCRSRENWLPWPLIFLACKAHDKGWTITVEDPRLPMSMVTGEYNVASVFDK